MCSHYISERRRAYYLKHYGIQLPGNWEAPRGTSHVYPTQLAPIVRRPREHGAGDEAVAPYEVTLAHFGLLPGFAKDIKFGVRTYNARSETVASLASFKASWAQARHCIVPCEAIYEPDWRTGTHVPTRFTAANDETLGVAGIWAPWKTPTGEWLTSFAMLTLNADDHALFRHMHRPDATRGPEAQDKRMVVILPEGAYADWLDATPQQSMDFMRQYPAERLMAVPEPLPAKPKPAAKSRRNERGNGDDEGAPPIAEQLDLL